MVIFDCVTCDYLITFVLQIKGTSLDLILRQCLFFIKNYSVFITLHDKKKTKTDESLFFHKKPPVLYYCDKLTIVHVGLAFH